MSTDQTQSSEQARPPRKVKLKSAFYFFVVLVLAFLVAMIVSATRQNAELRRQADASAKALASSVAIFGNQMIVDHDYSGLQARCDQLVRSKPLAYIAVSDTAQKIVVHTNREFLGKKVGDLKRIKGVVESSETAMNLTKQVGTVHTGVWIR